MRWVGFCRIFHGFCWVTVYHQIY